MRVIVAAVFGVLMVVVGGEALAQAKTAAPAGPTKVEVVNTVQTSEVEKPVAPDPTLVPCAPGSDNRNSDLCAQWKAADAAQKGEMWTFWGMFASSAAVIVSGVSLWFLRSNLWEMRLQGQREFRAYVKVMIKEIKMNNRREVKINAIAVNYGRTPAKNVIIDQYLFIGAPHYEDGDLPFPENWMRSFNNYQSDELHPQDEVRINKNYNFIFETKVPIGEKANSIAKLVTKIKYKDIFGRAHDSEIVLDYIVAYFFNGTAEFMEVPSQEELARRLKIKDDPHIVAKVFGINPSTVIAEPPN